MLAEIVYKDNYIDGEMDYIQMKRRFLIWSKGIEDFRLSPLMKYYMQKSTLKNKYIPT